MENDRTYENHSTMEDEIYIKGQYENRKKFEWCGILNGRTIPKFANFWNFDNFLN